MQKEIILQYFQEALTNDRANRFEEYFPFNNRSTFKTWPTSSLIVIIR
jgi:hypothetical protein